MRDKKENGSVQPKPVHPAVLQVAGQQARRWCAAIWSTSPGEQQLVEGIRSLVESTLLAHWIQPPAQYEPSGSVVNSFDAVFYESVDHPLAKRLEACGWKPVSLAGMATEEYEQFAIFEQEAQRHEVEISKRPSALWRLEIVDERRDEIDWDELSKQVAAGIGDEVWGQTPGWLSRAYCQKLERRSEHSISPSRRGLRSLVGAWFDDGDRVQGIRWVDGIGIQALCDFVGVVLQSTTSLEVQWGVCAVDDESGQAPAPLLRARRPRGLWQSLAVGRDVGRRLCFPWSDGARSVDPRDAMDRLVDEYVERCEG